MSKARVTGRALAELLDTLSVRPAAAVVELVVHRKESKTTVITRGNAMFVCRVKVLFRIRQLIGIQVLIESAQFLPRLAAMWVTTGCFSYQKIECIYEYGYLRDKSVLRDRVT